MVAPSPALAAPLALSPSELVVLLPHPFVGPGRKLTGAYEPLAGGDAVALNPLAEVALRAAVLGLEQAGLVQLDALRKTAVFGLFKSDAVTATRTDAPRPDAPLGALEGGLLAALEGLGGGPAEVDAVVYAWFEEDEAWPHKHVLAAVTRGLVERGLADEREEEARVLFVKTTRTRVELGPAGREALARASVDAAQALLAQPGREALLGHLASEVRQGLRRRTERDNGLDDFDAGD